MTLNYDTKRAGNVLVARLAGRMTEAFKGATLAKDLSGRVLFDLGAVERITSFGVREWLHMLQECEGKVGELYLACCAEPVVNQLSMIRRFAGGGHIVSFYAPYTCETCSSQFERLVDCEYDGDALAAGKAPAATCPKCAGVGAFDDDASTYLAFASSHANKPVPADVRALLAELEVSEEPVGGEPIEKTVEGRVTRVKVNAKIDPTVRWNRALDGLEGTVVLDLGSAPSATPEGAASLVRALGALGSEVEIVRIEGAPRPLVERLTEAAAPRARIVTAIVDGRCASCNAIRSVAINVRDNAAALREGRDPSAACKRCSEALSFTGARDLIAQLAQHAVREAAPIAPEPIKSRPPSAAPAAARVSVAPPSAAAPQAPAAQGGRGMYALLGALVVAVAGLGVMQLKGAATSPTPQPAASTATTAAAETTSTAAPSKTGAPSWSKSGELPPPWVERLFVKEGDDIFVVGRGGPAPTDEAALALARSDALERLAANMLPELAGSAVHDFVEARGGTDGRHERKEYVEQVARRYSKQFGSVATPERVDAVTRQRDGGIEAFARYKLSKQAFQGAVDGYKQTSAFQGLTVARFFPELEATMRTDGELIVVAIQKNWQVDLTGIRAGDTILEINEKPVSTVEAFSRVVQDEWSRTPLGGSLTMTVESAGARRTTRFIKPKTP